jgi:uncharacterized SAM-dependent methyltransferase
LPDGLSENSFVTVAKISVHSSQFPENVRRDLVESLRTGRVNHKFHYDSVKQTAKWLALHQAYSPSRQDADCAATYDRSFNAVAGQIQAGRVHVIGLGCGGGQKDTRLLSLLKRGGREVFYSPCDVSTAMVLVARQTAIPAVPEANCFPFVFDLAVADDLPAVLEAQSPRDAARLITFFGMIPNFEPQLILPKLAALVRPGDSLLFSANLAPGPDLAAGLRRVLPQYDNGATRDWLMTFLLDLGVEPGDGQIRFEIEDVSPGAARIAASFHFSRPAAVRVDAEEFSFRAGDSVRLFYSWRYNLARIKALLEEHGLSVVDEWITASQEEGVFLCQRTKSQ